MMPTLAAIVAINLVVLGWLFNRLVGLRNRAAAAWSDIDVQLGRRHDVVENLVQTVKGYAAHERRTLEQVVRARSLAQDARLAGPAQAGAAEKQLEGHVQTLLAVVEAYPDLVASDRFRDLQHALVEIEDAIQNARRYYNAVVRDMNTRTQSFPDVLVARLFGFRERDFFALDSPDAAQVPVIGLQAGR